MTINFTCEHCGKMHSLDKENAGTAVKCECGRWIIARPQRGRIYKAMSHAFHPIAFGKAMLGKERKRPGKTVEAITEAEKPAAPDTKWAKKIQRNKSFLVIAPPDGEKDADWAGLISNHLKTGEVDEMTAYAYTRQGKEAHDGGEHAEAFDLFEAARDCYGQYCQVLTERVTSSDEPEDAGESEELLSDLEKCMYNFAVLICATRIPAPEESKGRPKGRIKLLLEELALAGNILQRSRGFWDCSVVFSRNKEQLVNEISECFRRYGLNLDDFMGVS